VSPVEPSWLAQKNYVFARAAVRAAGGIARKNKKNFAVGIALR